MANNTIGWGQGATNNNIGWGRGSTNDIGWGSVYENSYVGDTDIQGADARFIITVKTDNAGTSASNQFTLPWIGTYDVEWGDGNSDVGVSGTQTHTYASAGTYDVAVTAASGRIFFNNGGDRRKLIDIKNWGVVVWTSMSNAFQGCQNLTIVSTTDTPDLSITSTLSTAFYNCSSLISLNVSDWDVSNISNYTYTFSGCTNLTTLDVNSWTTTSMNLINQMFRYCNALKTSFTNWDISNVTVATEFAVNTNINETGTTTNYDNTLISWAAQTPRNNIVINFGTAKYSWRAIEARNTLVNTYNWTITDGGIADDDEFVITVRTTTSAETFTIPTTGGGYNYNVNWGDGTSTVGETGNATHEYATAGDYDIQITGTFPSIYFANTGDKAKLIDIKNWGNGAWTSMERAFQGCTGLTAVSAEDIPNLLGVTSMLNIFAGCSSLTTLYVSSWDVSNVTNMQSMFNSCGSLTYLDVTSWDTSSVTNMLATFFYCVSFDADLSGLDIQSVTNFTSFATGATLSTANYDATLIGWEANLQATYPAGSGYTASININFGGSQFTLGSAAETARTSLRNTFGWTITDGGGVSGVLNQYTGAAAAYSLRNLSTATTSVVRVRRDSDNAEQDFTYDEIMDGTLATFVGAGNNGYVVTWYDQSGNGNHATQLTAANQGRLVTSGVVNLLNGMPYIESLSGFSGYQTNYAITGTGRQVYFVGQSESFNSILIGGYPDIVGAYFAYASQNGSPAGMNSNATTSNAILNGSAFNPSTRSDIYNAFYNTQSLLSMDATFNFTTNTLALGYWSFSSFGMFSMQEFVIYPSDQGANRINIENNINGYYNIYP